MAIGYQQLLLIIPFNPFQTKILFFVPPDKARKPMVFSEFFPGIQKRKIGVKRVEIPSLFE